VGALAVPLVTQGLWPKKPRRSDFSFNRITDYLGGTARLAFTQASGVPTPVPEQAWAYTDYTYDPNHSHAATALSTGEQYTYDANGNMARHVEGGVIYSRWVFLSPCKIAPQSHTRPYEVPPAYLSVLEY
jgi:hypothetical protein